MLIMILHPVSAAMSNHPHFPTDEETVSETHSGANTVDVPVMDTWFDSSLGERIADGSEEVRVTVITRSLQALSQWQEANGAMEKQLPAGLGESLVPQETSDGEIDHRTFWVDSTLAHKISGIPGVIAVIDAERAPEPYDTIPFEKPDGASPESVRS